MHLTMTSRSATVCALLMCCLLAGCGQAQVGVDPVATDRRASRGSGELRQDPAPDEPGDRAGTTAAARDGKAIASSSTRPDPVERPGAAPRATVTPDDDTAWESGRRIAVTVYFVHKWSDRLYLVPERRQAGVGGTAVESAARLALTEKPIWGGPANPFPPGTRLLGVTVAGGTATVDLSSEILAWRGSAEEARYSVQALACALADAGKVQRIRVRVEGRTGGMVDGRDVAKLWGGLAVTRPVQPDASIRMAPITLTQPRPRTLVAGGRLWIQGHASTGQGTVSLRLRDAAGGVVAQDFTTAESAAPERGAFSASLAFTPPRRPASWTLEVFEANPADGSITYQVDVPVLVGG